MPRLLEDGSTRLLEDGTARLLEGEVAYVGPTQVGFVYEEHLDPIKKRGKAILDLPLEEGYSLQFRRKTPIETDFDPVPQRPFNATRLEYELDKICFIQQELEGHLCDCRNETEPPYPGEPEIPGPTDPDPRPECQPYVCDALEQESIALGIPLWPCFEPSYQTNIEDINLDSVAPNSFYMQIQGIPANPWVDEGSPVQLPFKRTPFSGLDLCETPTYNITKVNTGALVSVRTDAFGGLQLPHISASLAVSNYTLNTNSLLLFSGTKFFTVYSDVGAPFSAQTESSARLYASGGSEVLGIVLDPGLSAIEIEFPLGTFTSNDYQYIQVMTYPVGSTAVLSDSQPGPWVQYEWSLSYSIYVWVNGVPVYEADQVAGPVFNTFAPDDTGLGEYTPEINASGEGGVMYDAYGRFHSISVYGDSIGLDGFERMAAAWLRNHAGYLPPEYCNASFPGDEI